MPFVRAINFQDISLWSYASAVIAVCPLCCSYFPMSIEFTPLVKGYGTFAGDVVSDPPGSRTSSQPGSRRTSKTAFHTNYVSQMSAWQPQPISGKGVYLTDLAHNNQSYLPGDALDPLSTRGLGGSSTRLPSTYLTRKGTLILYTKANKPASAEELQRSELERARRSAPTVSAFCDSLLQFSPVSGLCVFSCMCVHSVCPRVSVFCCPIVFAQRIL